MIFHTTRRRFKYPNITIDGYEIEFVEKFNLLGLILDNRLNWKHHVENVRKKKSKTSCIINKLKNKSKINLKKLK